MISKNVRVVKAIDIFTLPPLFHHKDTKFTKKIFVFILPSINPQERKHKEDKVHEKYILANSCSLIMPQMNADKRKGHKEDECVGQLVG